MTTTVAPLVGKQLESVRLATARVNIWEGSVRSSKTVSSLIAWLLFVRTGPAGNLLMVGRTERTLKRNVIDPLIEMLGPTRCRYVAGAGELFLLGRRIYVVGANDERSQDKIRGLTLAGAYVDEASTVPESFWSMLLTRLSLEGARLLATTNPDGPNHWIKKKFLDRAALHLTRQGGIAHGGGAEALDLARFSFQLADNPHLAPAYVEALGREFVGLWHRRFILGEWVIAEGAIYDMYDPDRHVVDRLPIMTRWVAAGIDYGTTNPFAALLIGLGVDHRMYVTSEWRHDSRIARRQMTDAEYSQAVIGWLAGVPVPATDLRGVRPEWVCVDPSAASFVVQLHRDRVAGVTQADNAVLDGIRTVSTLLGSDRLKVHTSCTGLLEELPGYSWDDKAAAKGEDAPLKVDDHSVDGLRYGIQTTQAAWRPHIDLVREAA